MATTRDAPHGSMADDGELVCKMGLCGNSGVGKTSIKNRLQHGEPFREFHSATVGPEFGVIKRRMPDGAVVRVTVWDTPGMDRCQVISSLSFRGAHAITAVYDITDRRSYDAALDWIARALQVCGLDDPYVIMVGNKFDLAATDRAVTVDEARLLCERYNYCFMEVSARDLTGIDELADALCTAMHTRYTRWRERLKGSKIRPPAPLPKSEALKIIDPLNLVNETTPRRLDAENAAWAAAQPGRAPGDNSLVDLSAVMAGGSRPVYRKPVSFWDRVSQMTCSN